MPTILIGGEKGGTGKSSIATNLAVYFAHKGLDVMLLDADPQLTAAKFITRRDEAKLLPEIQCVQKTGDIYKTAMDLAKRVDLLIIDAGGRDSKELRTGIVAADIMYVPIRASQADLETLPHVNEIIGLAKGLNPTLKAFAIISMAPTNPMINEAQEAKALIADFDQLELAPVMIRDRKIHRDALLDGKGVIEGSNTAAKAEIQLLGQAIQELLK